jgi:multidrug efflux pump subunit AcrA (membrane-fusion protein)
MRTNVLILALLFGVALQSGCGSSKQTSHGTPAGKPVQANAAAIQYRNVPAVAEAPGTVQPRNRIALASQINGFVRSMNIRLGDSVKTGQVLATLDARDAESQKAMTQASLDEAQAALSEARKAHQAATDRHTAARAATDLANQTYQRYQKLYESRSVSPQEMDEVRMRRDASAAELASGESMVAAAQDRIKQVEARIIQAKAQSSRADVMLSWTQIKAPVDGKIVERTADSGTAIFPGTPLMVVETTASPQVLADLPTEYASRLRTGMTVGVRNAETKASVDGRVVEIVPLSNPATHSIQFKVDLPGDFSAPNGQFVRVHVPVGERSALLVPRQAVRETGQLTGLFVVDGSSLARFRLVKAIPYDTESIEILSGVVAGEKVITQLSSDIIDGTPVEIRP